MKKNKVIFLLLFLVLMIISCGKSPTSSTDGGLNLPSNVLAYKADTIYQKGQYVYRKVSSSSLQLSTKTRASDSSDGVYQATTRIVGKDPAVFVISKKAPLNPWKVASLSEAKSALENKDATPTITVPDWNATDVYLAGAIVKSGIGYYKSLWWNKDNPSIPANQNGGGNWGPWKVINKEVAEKELGAETGNSTGSGSADNNTEKGSDKEETVVPPNADTSGEITGSIDSTVAAKYDWKASLVYLENNVCIYGDNYYRAKWWTQGDAPQANPKVAWDTPWQKITEDVFKKLAGGNIPPEKQPANDNTDAGIPPSGNTSGSTDTEGGSGSGGSSGAGTSGFASVGYDWAISKGYKEQWEYNEVPPALKAKLDAAKIFTKYGTNGAKAVELFQTKLNKDQWGELFRQALAQNGLNGYYSYENFKDALEIIGKYVYVVVRPTAGSWSQKCYVVYKGTGESDAKVRLVFMEGEDVPPSSSSDYTIIDYAAFGEEGTENDKIRVIAGFLAHASHETSGSWATAPSFTFDTTKFKNATFDTNMVTGTGTTAQLNGMLAWSLWFNEEVAYKKLTGAYYVDSYNKNFPPYVGDGTRKASSYHGRGAFQLSWNYNYGLASAIFFGDARVLNKYPEFVVNGVPATNIVEDGFNTDNWQPNGTARIEGGTMAFLSSLMFWLTPQGSKPSQQDTMILNTDDGKYNPKAGPGTAKLAAKSGLGQPGYGWTINIMNGGFEANKSWETGKAQYDAKVRRRVLHYKLFVAALGGKIDSTEKLDTVGNHSY